jgi:hypothetical protein
MNNAPAYMNNATPINADKIKIYCASYAFSGVWAFSPLLVSAQAPKEMLERSEFSSGEIWEATLADAHQRLWAFTPLH